MGLAVGEIFEGKVTGITKFGAFVSLPENKSGMVHISEVANTFVDDIKNFLTEGQEVRVKVMAIDEQGRINLSIKKAQDNAGDQNARAPRGTRPPMREGGRPPMREGGRPPMREGGRDGGGRPPMRDGNRDGGGRPPMRDNRFAQRDNRGGGRPYGRDDDRDKDDDDRPMRSSKRITPAPRDPALASFEDSLKMYMTTSEIRGSNSRHGSDRRNGGKRRK